MTRRHFYAAWLCATALSALIPGAYGQTGAHAREDARLITATQVLEELRQTPDQNVPDWLMQRAYGVAVIPEVIKGAFMFGGRYGNGALSVRDASGRFSNPIFITLIGGSVGWQIGATSTDVVLIFVTPRSVENFSRGKDVYKRQASANARPARFLRIEKQVAFGDPQLGDGFPKFDQNIALSGSVGYMRQLLGYVPIEPDGSVRVMVPANVPFQITVCLLYTSRCV